MTSRINYRVKLSIFLFLFFSSISNAQTNRPRLNYESYKSLLNDIYSPIKTRYPDLTFFKFKSMGNIKLSPYSLYDGSSNVPSLDAMKYLDVINTLDISNFKSDEKINIKYLQKEMVNGAMSSVVPISITFIKYKDLNPDALSRNYIKIEGRKVNDYSPEGYNIFTEKFLFAASPLNQIIKSRTVNFSFSTSLYLSNITDPINNNAMIDYGDGNGYVRLTSEVVRVNYSSDGEKNIKVKLNFQGTDFISNSTIKIESSILSENNSNSTARIQSTLTPPSVGPINISTTKLGKLVKGNYAVWFSPCNRTNKIRKPYIISAGFNPGSGKQLVPLSVNPMDLSFNLGGQNITIPISFEWRGTWYEAFNGSYNKHFSPQEYQAYGNINHNGASNGTRLLDRLRDEGYDIIILMYDDGTDYAINNAALFMELIEKVNQEKFSNNSYYENVVSGYSAGGIATKLALSLMESRYKQGIGPNPHTKTWVSIETENQGANVPLGFQHLVDYQSESNNLLPLSAMGLNVIQCTADWINFVVAKLAYSFNFNPTGNELLSYNATSNNNSHQDRNNLLNLFNSIPGNSSKGYPEFCRRVGIGMGSGIGELVPHSSPELFDSKLKMNPLGDSYTYSTCEGNETGYRPVTEKRTTARWWGNINPSSPLFSGSIYHSTKWTIMEKFCFEIWGNCICFGPIEIGDADIVIGEKNVNRPNSSINYDDVPSATQAFHKELYSNSAYGFYNNTLAGNSSCGRDKENCAFVPVVSSLDLKNPNTGQNASLTTSPKSLGLLKINPNTFEPNDRYGFIHLSGTQGANATPYNSIYAIGKNNGNYMDGSPKPYNQFHNEDAQSFLGDFVARVEIAPEVLFLSNREIGLTSVSQFTKYPAEFEARQKVLIGKNEDSGTNSIYSKYNNQDYLTPDGEFKVNSNGKLIVHAGNQIEFLPGSIIEQGGELEAFISGFRCDNLLYRNVSSDNVLPEYSVSTITSDDLRASLEEEAKNEQISEYAIKVFPNPNDGRFKVIDKTNDSSIGNCIVYNGLGEIVYQKTDCNLNNLEVDISTMEAGIYFVKLNSAKTSKTIKFVKK
ncbi:MAG: T9SS type A sorting domain-containing protein [Limnohabitans sp.]|nr:T9SS type A sorting domain-containing protein [Limnohabitans sp.]